MREKLKNSAKRLSEIREKRRREEFREDKTRDRELSEQERALIEEMQQLINSEQDGKTRRLLMYRYIDGAAPAGVQYILGISRSQYYRRLKGR